MALDRPRGRKRPAETPSSQLSMQGVNDVIEKRLFVARLPPDTEEEELRDIFIEFGALSECRIIPGRNWAYVRYDSWACAHRALLATDEKKALSNHKTGQTVAVSFAERQSAGRGGGAHLAKGLDNSRVFVRNLPEEATEKELEDLFGEHGEISNVNMLAAKSRGRSAFVTFALWGEALDAIEALAGSTWPNKNRDEDDRDEDKEATISVVMAEPQKGKGKGKDQAKSAQAPPDLEEFPEPKRRRIERPSPFMPRGGKPSSKGHQRSGSDDDAQFTEFERLKVAYLLAIDSDGPDRVCSDLHESLLDLRSRVSRDRGRHGNGGKGSKGVMLSSRPRVGPAGGPVRLEPSEKNPYPRLSITGLPRECTDDELEALIEQVAGSAKIRECFVEDGRGIGYVELFSDDVAQAVKDALHERRVTGWDEPLCARWAPLSRPGDGGGPMLRPRPRPRSWSSRADSPRRMANAEEASQWRRGRSQPRESGGKSGGRTNIKEEDSTSSVEGRRVYCGQLLNDAEFEDVRFLFEPFGDIQACRHIADKSMAYITFFQAADAEAAVEGLNGKVEPRISRGEGGLKVAIAAPPKAGKGGSKGKRD